MKTGPVKPGTRQRGWVLLVVMSLSATGLLLVASIMTWASENAAVTARNSEYFTTAYAAEAATEKALGAIVQDDQNYGEGNVMTKNATSAYTSLIPNASDSPYWTNYQFSGGTTLNSIIVNCVNPSITNVAGPPYTGLLYVGPDYQIIANAQNLSSMYKITATVGQQVILGQIPIFQFAIFYNDTLEIDPGANMTVNGLVHCNTNVYVDPNAGVTLIFSNDVSATGTLDLSENPSDPSSRNGPGTIDFYGNHIADVNPLNLPVGTNTSGTANQGANVNAILQVPPPGESPNSSVGTNRLYNQVDMIITISNNNSIRVTSGVDVNNAATVISNNQWSSFISTNGSFYNMRDGQTVDPVDINVGALRQWSATNTVLRPLLAAAPSRGANLADVQSIYVVDQRFMSNMVITTNVSYTTNTTTTTTSGYPSGSFVPPVTTNSSQTTGASLPGSGTYLPPILSTNVTTTTTSSHPNSGTYVGGITTNGSGVNKTYTYNKITGYIYNAITGYTYAAITGVNTNINYASNYIEYAEPGIVLTNGGTLPSNGLSVVTPDPLYVLGNWNVTNNQGHGQLQTYDDSDTLPSAIFADAITILSPSWSPNNTQGTASRATPDTVNAAFLTGIVPSTNPGFYSGGVENFPRFQEDWGNINFYYTGSMVEMFTSQIANYPWPGTGTVYNPPNRLWAFDTNFSNPSKLPPLTPRAIYLNRAKWCTLAPGATSF